MNNIARAMNFATYAFRGKLDDEGKTYFKAHCLQVYNILKQVTDDEDVLVAGLLHDIIEDTPYLHADLQAFFGKRVADLVNEVTHEGQADQYGYYFPRLHSKEAILIKFADRLSNLSRMGGWPKGRQRHYMTKSRFWRRSREEKR